MNEWVEITDDNGNNFEFQVIDWKHIGYDEKNGNMILYVKMCIITEDGTERLLYFTSDRIKRFFSK